MSTNWTMPPSSSEEEEEETNSKIYGTYMSLAKQGSDFSVFLKKMDKGPAVKSKSPLKSPKKVTTIIGGNRKRVLTEEEDDKMTWSACVLWNTTVLKEFELHQEMEYKLHSDLALGRFLSTSVVQEATKDWPSTGKMDWRADFVLVGVKSDTIGTCGVSKFIRVQETPWTGNLKEGKILWDLVVPEECTVLLEEMTRRWRHGVKTTVMLWQVFKQPYSKPWRDGGDEVKGELHFRPGRKGSKPSAVIFHQEELSERRRRKIKEGKWKSELRGLEGVKGTKHLFWEGMEGNLVLFHVVKYKEEDDGGDDEEESIEVDEGEKTVLVEEGPKPEGMETRSGTRKMEQARKAVELEEESRNKSPLRRSLRVSPLKKQKERIGEWEREQERQMSEDFRLTELLEEL